MSDFLDWDTAEEVVTGNSDDLFYELQDGLNVFRVVSNAFKMDVHWFRFNPSDKTVKKFIAPKEGDPLKARGENPGKRFAFIVLPDNEGQGATALIDRKVQVLEVGPQIYNDIVKLTKDIDLGHPKTYDIKVTKKGKGRDTEYFTSGRPVEKCEQLTPEVEERIKEKGIDFTKVYKVSTPQEMLDYINGGGESKSQNTTSKRQSENIDDINELDDDIF